MDGCLIFLNFGLALGFLGAVAFASDFAVAKAGNGIEQARVLVGLLLEHFA